MLDQLSQLLTHTQKPVIQKIYDPLIILSGQRIGVKHKNNLGIIDNATTRKSKN